MIYFDKYKQAYGFEIENPIATVSDELWGELANDRDGWTIENGEFIDLRNTDPYKQQQLATAKEKKYNEAKNKAYAYLESGEALYEFEPNKHIEATDGNIAKFTAYALQFASGVTTPVVWCTKEDETVFLNQEQVTDILQGLGAVQAQVWTIKFTYYIEKIDRARTVKTVNNIVIDYSQDVEG